jgi:hypothetical protein
MKRALYSLSAFNGFKYIEPATIIVDAADPWGGEPPVLPQMVTDIKILNIGLDLFIKQFSDADLSRKEVCKCGLCHRLFFTKHLGRRYCSRHSPKKNRQEYDRCRMLLINIPSQEIDNAILKGCESLLSNQNPSLLVTALHFLPFTSFMLSGLSTEQNTTNQLRFIIGRLDVADTIDDMDHLLSYFHQHPTHLADLLLSHEAHATAAPKKAKKRGPKHRLKPELAKSIRGEGGDKKTFQEVADILAKDHKVFVVRQTVHAAAKSDS